MKSFSVLKWINQVIGKNKIWIILLTLVQSTQGVLGVVFAISLREVIDSATRNDNLVKNIIIICGVVGAMIISAALNKYLDEKAKAILEKNFRNRAFSSLLRRSYAEVTDVHSGEWMNRITSDTTVVVNSAVQIIPGLCGTVVRLTGAVIILFVLIKKLVFLLILAGILLAIFSLAVRNKLKQFHKNSQQADGKVRSFMQERINNLIIVKTFIQEDETEKSVKKYSDVLVKTRMKRIHFVNACTTAMHLAMRGAYLLGVIVCASKIASNDPTMSYGTMMAILQLINQVEAPFSNISGYLPQYYGMIASAERLIEIENMPTDFDGEMISNEAIKEYYENDFSAVGLHNVYFSYVEMGNGKTHVLNKKSIEIKKGEYVAFVGKSGCGKSTAMKLMMSLYPLDKGEKYLLNKDGTRKDLSADWRGLFSYVPQGNYLVSGTIREVLTFGDTVLMQNDDEIYAALKVACADEFVRELPNGLDTVLGEQGSGLSEGQIQRLAIARAIMSGRPILMLDEATSSLDGATEEQLLMNLHTMTDKTVILITHRPAALSICDRKIKF